MTSEKNYFRHTVCLSAAFTLGEGILFLPKQSILSTLIGGAACLIISLLIYLFLKTKLSKSGIFYLIVFFASIIAGSVCFFEYCVFAGDKMLPYSSYFLPALIFALCVAALFFSAKEALFKFALVSFTVAALLRAAVGFFLLKNVSVSNALRFTFSVSAGGILKAVLLFLPVNIALIYLKITGENERAFFYGFSLSALQMITFSAIVFGVLGKGAYTRTFSLLDAVSTANAGRIFTRTDAVLYIIFFLSALIKTAVCLKTATLSFKNLKNLLTKS